MMEIMRVQGLKLHLLELHFEVLREREREISWKCITRNGSIFQSTAVSRHEFKRVLLDVQLPVGETHRCTSSGNRGSH